MFLFSFFSFSFFSFFFFLLPVIDELDGDENGEEDALNRAARSEEEEEEEEEDGEIELSVRGRRSRAGSEVIVQRVAGAFVLTMSDSDRGSSFDEGSQGMPSPRTNSPRNGGGFGKFLDRPKMEDDDVEEEDFEGETDV